MKRFNLENRVSIITGGGGLLGFQHAQALVEVNSRIVLIDTNYKHLLKHKNFFNKKGVEIQIYKADITNEKKIKKICKSIIKKFQRIDILVNNASIDYKPKKHKKNYI